MAEGLHVLRAARERAGLSLDEVAARTRIKPHFLSALERGEFERLPGDFFARAFLRTYARELGLRPSEALAEYELAMASAHPEPAAEAIQMSEAATMASWSETPRMGWVAVAGGVALVALILAFNQRDRQTLTTEAGAPVQAGVVGTSGVSAPEERVGTTATPEPIEGLELELTATGETWLAATADGTRVVYRLLRPGEHVALEATDGITMRIGNAGALEYKVNGRPGIPLGGPGSVRTVQVTRDNYKTFQQ